MQQFPISTDTLRVILYGAEYVAIAMSTVSYESSFALQCNESLNLWNDFFVINDPQRYTMAWIIAIAANTVCMFAISFERSIHHGDNNWILHVRADPLNFVTANVTNVVKTVPLGLVYRLVAFTIACVLWLFLRYDLIEGCEYAVPVMHANTLLLINWMELFCGRSTDRVVLRSTEEAKKE